MHRTARLGGVLSAVALTAGSLGTTALALPAHAAKPTACSQQQKQLDQAEAALARVTAVFEHQQDRVARSEHRAAQADTAHERNAARKAVRAAKHDRSEARKDKKAQQQRVSKAEYRLEACQGQEDDTAEG